MKGEGREGRKGEGGGGRGKGSAWEGWDGEGGEGVGPWDPPGKIVGCGPYYLYSASMSDDFRGWILTATNGKCDYSYLHLAAVCLPHARA